MLTGERSEHAGAATRRASRSRSTQRAAAARGPTPTSCPTALADIEPGEAGARRVRAAPGARRSCSGTCDAPPGIELKPVVARVRSRRGAAAAARARLARWISDHYLAPPAIVVRAMLPPGLLERLDLVARAVRPGDVGDRADLAAAPTATCSTQLDRGAAPGPEPRRAGGPSRARAPAPGTARRAAC